MSYVIHITDPHVGFKKSEERFGILINQIIETYKESHHYTIVITGDIVEGPELEARYSAAARLINKLRDASFNVLICPGNHDYGKGIEKEKFQISLFKQFFLSNAKLSFPIKNEFINHNDEKTVFIGLDSMPEELRWDSHLSRNGKVGASQLERLRQYLEEKDVKNADYLVIYLHHHPFGAGEDYTLIDSNALKEVLVNSAKSVDALLFGHKHDNRIWNEQWGIPRVYDGGSCTFKHNATFSYRLIDLTHRQTDLDEQPDFLKKYKNTLKKLGLMDRY